jgi:hypothetical protein
MLNGLSAYRNLINKTFTLTMKNSILASILLVALATVFYGCQETEEPLFQHPIIGDWESNDSGNFVRLFLEGVEKTPTEFGMEVFQLNESHAGPYVEAYLQNQILGPIDLGRGALVFGADNVLRSQLGDASLEGIWSLYNSESRLRLQVDGLPNDQYGYDIQCNRSAFFLGWKYMK